MLAAGLVNKEIAARLAISITHRKFHVASILGKLALHSNGSCFLSGIRRESGQLSAPPRAEPLR